MKRRLLALWRENDGMLSFEWTMVVTLLTIGVVAGLAAARDAIIDELGDLAQAAGAIDQSFTLSEIDLQDPDISAPGMSFTDDAMIYSDCDRASGAGGQATQADGI